MADKPANVALKNDSKEITTGWSFDPFWRRMDHFFNQPPYPIWRAPGLVSRDFDQFWRPEGSAWAVPPVDIAEKEQAYEVTAELPGLSEKNIEVNYADGVLTIKGEKQESKEEKKTDYYLSERRFGSFRRSFSVPDAIDATKIEAAFHNGILTVTLPKSKELARQEKKIPIAVKQ